MSDYFIARQPILDSSLGLYAYELLFRTSDSSDAPRDFDHDVATATVLSTGEALGISRLVGGQVAFINLPEKFLLEPDLLPLEPESRVVLEVLEHVTLNDGVIAGMRTLAERGYMLALDDYVYHERFEQALDYVAIVKLDIPQIPQEEWAQEIQRLQSRGIRVLAEKVETNEEFELLADLGCDYFQGYFFAKPKVVSGKQLTPNKVALLELMSKINDPDIDIDTLSDLVSQDIALSLRAINYVNSAASALNRRVESVREAVVYIGRETIRRWVTLFLMAKVDNKPCELVTMALVRAKFLEQLARQCDQTDDDAFFTVGLFSQLDALMDTPMPELMKSLSLTDDLRAALGEHKGSKGEALELATALEHGRLSDFVSFDIGASAIADLHRNATAWADETVAGMGLA
jgi:EAL and modified HD-GYP domain-containing signal transduction protein